MDLKGFLAGGVLPLNIVTVESSLYLPYLRENYPNSELFAFTAYEEVINHDKYQKLNVNWILNNDITTFPEKFFDIVIAESLLTYAKNSYSELMNVSRALKDTGFFLSAFKNIRFAPILNELKEGRFPFREERLYAKDEVVKMLNDAIFKEISFSPMDVDFTAQDAAETFIRAGYQNFNNDLLTKTWMFKASVSTSEVLALKELYTEDIRKNLSKILHRIEYDVEREKNLALLWDLTEKERIFPDYLLGFVHETCVQKRKLLEILANSAKKRELNEFMEAIDEVL